MFLFSVRELEKALKPFSPPGMDPWKGNSDKPVCDASPPCTKVKFHEGPKVPEEPKTTRREPNASLTFTVTQA